MNRNKWITGGDMRTPVIFYKAVPNEGPEPGENIQKSVYSCFADVYPPSYKDLKMTGHEATVSLETYHPQSRIITDDMYFEIDLPMQKGKFFNIYKIEEDMNHLKTIKIIGVNRE